MRYPFLYDDGGPPWALDSYGGQGGVAKGLQRAGFRVCSVDIVNHSKRSPADLFIVADALEFVAEYARYFPVKHGSPSCQGYSRATAGNLPARNKYDRSIGDLRELFIEAGGVYMIENVEDAKPYMLDPILLCGRMFGLTAFDEDGALLHLDRHRLFESNVDLHPLPHPLPHRPGLVGGVYGGSRRAKRRPGESLESVAPRDRHEAKHVRKGGYVPRSRRVREELMGGVDWMTVKGLEEAIPPVYAEYLGHQLMRAIGR